MRQLLMLTAALAAVPTASPAEVIDVSDNHGGAVAQYDQRWHGIAARGVDVRIIGPCKSACTVLLAHIPRGKICVTPDASFGYPSGAAPRDDHLTLERVSGGRSRLDHEARRSPSTRDRPGLAASARDVQVLAQVRVACGASAGKPFLADYGAFREESGRMPRQAPEAAVGASISRHQRRLRPDRSIYHARW